MSRTSVFALCCLGLVKKGALSLPVSTKNIDLTCSAKNLGLSIRVKTRWMHHPSLLHRHRDVRDEPLLQAICPQRDTLTLRTKEMPSTVSDSSASQTDSGVHWDFSSRSSARRIQLTSHLKRIKEEDGAQ